MGHIYVINKMGPKGLACGPKSSVFLSTWIEGQAKVSPFLCSYITKQNSAEFCCGYP